MHTTQMCVLCVFADEKILIKHSLKLAFDFLINVSKRADIIEFALTTTTPLQTYCSREFVLFLFCFYVFFLDRCSFVRCYCYGLEIDRRRKMKTAVWMLNENTLFAQDIRIQTRELTCWIFSARLCVYLLVDRKYTEKIRRERERARKRGREGEEC